MSRADGARAHMAEAARRWPQRVLRRHGLALRRIPAPLIDDPGRELRPTLHDLVARRGLEAGFDFFFIQVGAFDGKTGDPIHEFVDRYGWRGLLVEPQVEYFEQLRANYAGRPGLTLLNVAIDDQRRTRTLYTVREEWRHTAEWAPQLASFDKRHLLDHGYPDEAVIGHDVECVTVGDLLDLVPTDHVDLLQIDVEGYDYEILRRLDFARFRPWIVRFEHKHLSRADHEAAIRLLLAEGYDVTLEPAGDTAAFLARPRDA